VFYFFDLVEDVWKMYDLQKNSLNDRRIVKLSSYGLSAEQVAKELCMSPHTVRSHIKGLKKRFRVSRMIDLVAVMQNLQII